MSFTFLNTDNVLSTNYSAFSDLVYCIYPTELIYDTSDYARSASYLDIYLEIDSEDRLRTTFYDKRDHFNFPIAHFPFICRTYQHHLHVECIYSRSYGCYHDLLGRRLLLAWGLLNQGFLVVKLTWLLRKGFTVATICRYRNQFVF